MIIALKDKDSVYVAASIEYSYTDMHTDDIINEENLKMWHPEGKEGSIMASVTPHAPCIDLMRGIDFEEFDKPLTSATVIREFCPHLKGMLEEAKMLNDGEMWSEVIIAKDDKAFCITTNFTVCDVEDFEAIGRSSTEDIAYGFLAMNRELAPIDRIAGAFRAIEAGDASRHFPIVVMNTKSKTREVIYK